MYTNKNTLNVLRKGIWIGKDGVYRVRRLPRSCYVRVTGDIALLCVQTWVNGISQTRYRRVRIGSPSYFRLRRVVQRIGYVRWRGFVSFSLPGVARRGSREIKFYLLAEGEEEVRQR